MTSTAIDLAADKMAALRDLGSATIHEAQGRRGALSAAIKPIDANSRVAGRVLTVDAAPADNLVLHYALLQARPGDVLVVDAKGFLEAGPWGDVMTEAALARGIAGLVIDGAVRDATTIIEMNFPVFSRGLSIKGTAKVQPGSVGRPIVIGGIPVTTGDFVVGDRDGVVVIAAADVEPVLEKARHREEVEEGYRLALRQGRTTVELLGLEERRSLIDFA